MYFSKYNNYVCEHRVGRSLERSGGNAHAEALNAAFGPYGMKKELEPGLKELGQLDPHRR